MGHFNFESEAMKSLRAVQRNIPMTVIKDFQAKKSGIESARRAYFAYEKFSPGTFENLEVVKRAKSNIAPKVFENIEIMQPSIDIASITNSSVAEMLSEIRSSLNIHKNLYVGTTSHFEALKSAVNSYNNLPRSMFSNFDVVKSAMATYNRKPSEIFNTVPEIFKYSNTLQVPELSRLLRDITFDENAEMVDNTETEELPVNVLHPVYAEWIYLLFPIALAFFVCGFDTGGSVTDTSVKSLMVFYTGIEYGKVFLLDNKE